MNILRRLFLALFGVGLGLALLATAWAHVGVATIGNRDTVKTWLVESGFYDNVVDAVLEAANKEQAKEGESEIPIDNPQIQAVAQDAFSPTFLQENIEEVLDGTYAWLEGDTPKPEFVIDVSTAKQKLADGLANYAISHAASLPACTPEQMAEMSTEEYDVLNATCLPPGTDTQAAAEKLRSEIMNSEQFLADTTYSGEDFKVEEDGQQVNLGESEYRRAQTAYKLASYGPYIFAGISLLLAVAVFFLSATKRRGLRRVGIIYIVAGAILGLTFIGYNQSSSWLSSRAQNLSGETSAGRILAARLVEAVGQDISSLLLWYAIGFAVIGVVGVLIATLYKRDSKPGKPAPSEPKPPVDDSPSNEPAKKPEPSTAAKPAPKKPPKPPVKIQL